VLEITKLKLKEIFGVGVFADDLPKEAWIKTSGREVRVIYEEKNKRIKFFDLNSHDLTNFSIVDLINLMLEDKESFFKIMIYSKIGDEETWKNMGFSCEAVINNYFEDSSDAFLWSNFSSQEREECDMQKHHDKILEKISDTEKITEKPGLPEGYKSVIAQQEDSQDISQIINSTFEKYPDPVSDEYIQKKIETGSCHYRLIKDDNNELVSIVSGEIDSENNSVEMTDCITAPKERGKGLLTNQLWNLEKDIKTGYGLEDLFSVARASIPSVNKVFYKLGYKYSGRLLNNSLMPEGMESMNIWCKKADK
jgi:putative beta-lysine N-acetyltransferase